MRRIASSFRRVCFDNNSSADQPCCWAYSANSKSWRARTDLLSPAKSRRKLSQATVARKLFELTEYAQQRGWSAEELLSERTQQHELALRRVESAKAARQKI